MDQSLIDICRAVVEADSIDRPESLHRWNESSTPHFGMNKASRKASVRRIHPRHYSAIPAISPTIISLASPTFRNDGVSSRRTPDAFKSRIEKKIICMVCDLGQCVQLRRMPRFNVHGHWKSWETSAFVRQTGTFCSVSRQFLSTKAGNRSI